MATFRVPVKIEAARTGAPYMNVWHVRTVSGTSGELGDLANAVEAIADVYLAIKDYMADGMKITLGEGMIKDPLGNPEYVPDNSIVINTAVGDGSTAPPLLAIVASWRTSSATRSGRGRTFFGPFLPNRLEPDGTPANEVVTAVRESCSDLVSASTGLGGWSVGVLSTKQGLLRDVTGVSVKDRWSYLSSRRA